MKLTNRTTIDTDKLHQLFIEVHRRLRRKRPTKLAKLEVRFYWSRRPGLSSGGAVLDGTEVRIGVRRVAGEGWMGSSWDPREVARTIDHELRHIYGMDHKAMKHDPASYRTTANLARFAWAWDFCRPPALVQVFF